MYSKIRFTSYYVHLTEIICVDLNISENGFKGTHLNF